MEKVEMSAEGNFNVSVNKAWEIFKNFGDLSWYGSTLEYCNLEGNGSTGSKRTISVKGFGTWTEHLDLIDHKNNLFKYTILDGHPFPFKNYRGTIKVTEKGKNNSIIKWVVEFEVESSKVEQTKKIISLIIDKARERINDILKS